MTDSTTPIPPAPTASPLLERVIVAGFGGQGIIFFGKLLAQAAMDQGLSVAYLPAYGPEVRGGRANCYVVISSDPILCPVVLRPDSLVVMNQLSWDYYARSLGPEGLAVLNATMVAGEALEPAQRVVRVPATQIATELGEVRATNMVMLGAYNHLRRIVPLDRLLEDLRAALGKSKAALFELNRAAISRGIEAVAGQ